MENLYTKLLKQLSQSKYYMSFLSFEVAMVGFSILALLVFRPHILNRYERDLVFSIR